MFTYLLIISVFCATVRSDYWSERQQFIENEKSLYLGSKINLNEVEQQVNKLLMKYKKNELKSGFDKPGDFAPIQHFFKARNTIKQSQVYKIIKQMPKGSALHVHDTALLQEDWLLNVTYRDNLYGRIKNNVTIELAFADPAPSSDGWQLLKKMREDSGNIEKFDRWLKSKFTLITNKPEDIYTNINDVWNAFTDIFSVITPLLTYRAVFIDYMLEVMETFYNDNVQYIELRSTMPLIYDLNGWPANPIQVVGILKYINDKFLENHPDSLGMKLIYAPSRHVDAETCDEYLQIFRMMQETYPDFVLGFDLVGQEDLGKPLTDFVTTLLQYKDDVKFFFHAAETDWNGMSTDMNIIDAVLLNTTRIGHGYGIVKHPKVMEEVKKRGIALEINPISNQVLMLVKDLRNHPGSILMAQDFPIVISSDDPGFWGAEGLTDDFYIAFMTMANADADLKFLKQLSLNSIYYSGLTTDEKGKALDMWQKKWDKFLNDIVNTIRY